MSNDVAFPALATGNAANFAHAVLSGVAIQQRAYESTLGVVHRYKRNGDVLITRVFSTIAMRACASVVLEQELERVFRSRP